MATYLRRPYYPGGMFAPRVNPLGTAFTGGGDYASQMVGGINQILQQRRIDAVANQLMNANLQPGEAQHTGGVAEYQALQTARQNDLANALQQAKIQRELALAGGGGGGGGGAGGAGGPGQLKPAQVLAEQHRQVQTEQQQEQRAVQLAQQQQKAGTDTPEKILRDFNSLYPGKIPDPDGDTNAQGNPSKISMGEAIYNARQNGFGGRGNIVNGQFVGDPNGEFYTPMGGQTVRDQNQVPKIQSAQGLPASQVPKIRWDQLQGFEQRLDAIRAARGGAAVPVPRAQPVGLVPQAGTPAAQLAGAGTAAPRAQLVSPPQTRGAQGIQPAQPGMLNPFDVGGPFGPGGQYDVTQTGGGSQQAPPALPTPKTDDEFAAIPSGSQFVDLDGYTKTKP